MDAIGNAGLVERVVAGDAAARGELYDRFAPRIHDLCLHLLRDPHEAADATADVFLAALEKAHQLRDPDRLLSWLYAIARNEVRRRGRRRSRERVMVAELPDDLPMPEDGPVSDPDGAMALLREAALGLDERDQLVLELTLAGGLDGRDLADALGVEVGAAHQAAHRMRERLGRSVGALLVARQGRADCDALAAVLRSWDGTFSVLWRKRVARHVDGCEVCDRRRRGVPAGVLSGTAFAAPLPIRYVAPPPEVRARVLDATPRRGGAGRRTAAAAVALLILLAAGLGGWLAWRDDAVRVTAAGSTRRTTTSTSPSTVAPTAVASAAPTTTTAAPAPPAVPAASTTAPRPSTTLRSTTTTARPSTTTTSAAVTTTTTPGPTIRVAVPPGMHASSFCPPNADLVATVSASVGSVSMSWSLTTANGPTSGTLFFTKSTATSWTRSWQPTATGDYTVDFRATDNQNRTATQRQVVSVGVCIP